jgi:phosphomannomutase
MDEPIISVSGLRGIVGQSLTPGVAKRYAAAFIAGLPAGPIVITRDGRTHGPLLADAICQAILSTGRDVLDGDVAATPTTGVLVRHLSAAGGIQISASHNPPEYNGMKLMSGEGRVISADDGAKVIERYRQSGDVAGTNQPVSERRAIDDTTSAHLDLVLATVDVERIKARSFSVLLDANCGSGALLGRRLLEALGCRVTILGEEPSGLITHPAEPTAENLAGVLKEVTEIGADVGFCQDPDADRLAVIDEAGRYLGEEYTLAMCVEHVLRSAAGPIVTNCSTSRMSQDIAERHGAAFYSSAVGEANVVEVMQANDALLGGEGNGGVIDPRVGFVRDSFVGMALLLDAMAARDLAISSLADELPRYEIEKTKVTLDRDNIPAALDALQKHFADAEFNTLDGLRLDWPGSWLLVRASNTEPIVRAIAEAPSIEEARRLCTEATEVLSVVSS